MDALRSFENDCRFRLIIRANIQPSANNDMRQILGLCVSRDFLLRERNRFAHDFIRGTGMPAPDAQLQSRRNLARFLKIRVISADFRA